MFEDKIRGDRVEEAMRELGYTQQSLGAAIGLSQGSIHNIVSGTRQFSIPKFIDLCRVLRRSADYLLGLGDNPAPGRLGPHQLLLDFTNSQAAEIARGVLACLASLPLADKFFLLALLRKISDNTTNQTPEATEAGAVIDTLPAPVRASVLAAVYQAATDYQTNHKRKVAELEYLADVARAQGIDVDRLISERFGVRLPEK